MKPERINEHAAAGWLMMRLEQMFPQIEPKTVWRFVAWELAEELQSPLPHSVIVDHALRGFRRRYGCSVLDWCRDHGRA